MEAIGWHGKYIPNVSMQEATFVAFTQGVKDQHFPSVRDGVACQRVLDALEKSAAEKRWVDVEK